MQRFFDDILRSSQALQDPVPGSQVLFHKKTSRVYNIHANCGEERQHATDGVVGRQELTVTRSLGDRSCTFTQSKDLRTGREEVSRSRRHVTEHEEDEFEQEWMRAATESLPHYQQRQITHQHQPQQRQTTHQQLPRAPRQRPG